MKQSFLWRKIGLTFIAFALPFGLFNSVKAEKLDNAIRMVIAKNDAAAKSQARIEKTSDDTDKLLTQYRDLQRQIDSLKIYNEQVKTLVDAQRKQIAGLDDQINKAAKIGREITPLMLRMIDTLDAFIKLDVPFLLKERTKRVATLRDMMNRSDVTDSEKFRRILEAYQIENDYGRNIEAYKAKMPGDSKNRTVDFLRIGRVVLAYKSLDSNEIGFWDKDARKWQTLPKEYYTSLQDGFRIARKQSAPDLIRLPIPAAKDVQ